MGKISIRTCFLFVALAAAFLKLLTLRTYLGSGRITYQVGFPIPFYRGRTQEIQLSEVSYAFLAFDFAVVSWAWLSVCSLYVCFRHNLRRNIVDPTARIDEMPDSDRVATVDQCNSNSSISDGHGKNSK